MRAIPLDENLIRLLTPDSYRALRELQESNKQSIAAVTRRTAGARRISGTCRSTVSSRRAFQSDGAGDHERRARFPAARGAASRARVSASSGYPARDAKRHLPVRREHRPRSAAHRLRFRPCATIAGRPRFCTRVERERALVRARASRTSQYNSINRINTMPIFRSASFPRPRARASRNSGSRRSPRGLKSGADRALLCRQTLSEIAYPQYAANWETAVEDANASAGDAARALGARSAQRHARAGVLRRVRRRAVPDA